MKQVVGDFKKQNGVVPGIECFTIIKYTGITDFKTYFLQFRHFHIFLLLSFEDDDDHLI